ncbi:hypothetical protein SDJN02_27684, partial [Cucurbita argyrosperma subsp. argyrosperma]
MGTPNPPFCKIWDLVLSWVNIIHITLVCVGLDLSLQDGAVGDGAYLFMQCPYRFAVHRLLCAALSNLFQPQIGPVVNNWKLCGRGTCFDLWRKSEIPLVRQADG